MEAVGENKWGKLHLVSARIQKNHSANQSQNGTVTHTSNVTSPGLNVRNAYASPVDKSVANGSENVNDKFSLKTDTGNEENRALFDNAKKIFGTTYNWNTAGYILPDGTRLDFSGKREGSSGQYREEDHRAILEAYGEDADMRGTEAMIDFMRRGAIRIMPESGSINIQGTPTKAQLQALDGFISKMCGEVTIDIDNENGDTLVFMYAKNGHDTIEIPFDIDAIPEVPCSFKKKWWR